MTISVWILRMTRLISQSVGQQMISSFSRSLKTPNFTWKLKALLRTLFKIDLGFSSDSGDAKQDVL